MFGRVLGHFTILFWGFGTKMNEDDEKCKSKDWFASLLNFYVQKCKSSHHATVEKKIGMSSYHATYSSQTKKMTHN